MKIKLKANTKVLLPADTIVEVDEREGLRLLAYNLGAKVEEPKAEPEKVEAEEEPKKKTPKKGKRS